MTKGMRVVGPRPALPNEVATYNDYQRQRLLVKPGMTCYWQTRRNRDSITFDEWVDLDLCDGIAPEDVVSYWGIIEYGAGTALKGRSKVGINLKKPRRGGVAYGFG
ncbi:sugar transferase [Senegalimassilia anaerobia]|uniref:sugar transferase n=2 Tax=Senegalimassilia TaxID=1473205 RepID=UPI00265FC1F2|nr:sugar transferase [Senegalimassilia anaerobia]